MTHYYHLYADIDAFRFPGIHDLTTQEIYEQTDSFQAFASDNHVIALTDHEAETITQYQGYHLLPNYNTKTGELTSVYVLTPIGSTDVTQLSTDELLKRLYQCQDSRLMAAYLHHFFEGNLPVRDLNQGDLRYMIIGVLMGIQPSDWYRFDLPF